MAQSLSRIFILCLSLVAAAGRMTAQTPAEPAKQETQHTPFIEQLLKQRRTLKLENGNLSGDGAAFLFEEAKTAQFFFLGEDHGIAELPLLTTALFSSLYAQGYQRFAIEAGPITAKKLESLAAAPQAFNDFNHQYPFSLPFFFWREEAAMLESAMKTAGNKATTFWGLDQEFIASPVFHLKRLAEIAHNENARAVVASYYEKTRSEFTRSVESKNPSVVFLASATADDFNRLDDAFKSSANAEAKRILSELRESWEIYQKNFTGRGYASNAQRAQLMKRHFMEYYNAASGQERTPPKVLLKFGANHAKRGRNYTNVYDIGNLVAELANINGSTSFHLLVIGLNGTQNKYLPFLGNDADKAKKIDLEEAWDFVDLKPIVAAFSQKEWTVIDLRPLRSPLHAGRLGTLPRGMAELIWGFDAVLLLSDVHASTLFE